MHRTFEDFDRHGGLLLPYAWECIEARPQSGGSRGARPDPGSLSRIAVGNDACGIDNPAGYLIDEPMELGILSERSLNFRPALAQLRWVECPNPLQQPIRDRPGLLSRS